MNSDVNTGEEGAAWTTRRFIDIFQIRLDCTSRSLGKRYRESVPVAFRVRLETLLLSFERPSFPLVIGTGFDRETVGLFGL